MGFGAKVRAVVWKDLVAEFRSKETLSAMLVFSLLVVAVFGFAFEPDRETVRDIFPGLLWVTFFFAGLLGLNRSFVNERSSDALHGLMLCPVDRSAIYFGKVAANLLFTLVMEAVAAPALMIFMNYPVALGAGQAALLLAVVLLATFGFIAVGTFLAALAANTRASEILLPVILFPVTVPLVLAGVQATAEALTGGGLAAVLPWLNVAGVYDLVFVVVPWLLFDYVLEV